MLRGANFTNNIMNIIELIDKSHLLAIQKGFWDEKRDDSERTLLIISNVGDIVKAHRRNKFADWIRYDSTLSKTDSGHSDGHDFKISFEEYIKDSFEDEIANVIIRICDFIGGNKVDIFELNPWMREYSELPINDFLRYAQISREYSGNISDWLHESLCECSYYSREADKGLMHLLCHMGSMVCGLQIDIEKHIALKLRYNEDRPRLYGK